jgi:hypothetical protein
MTNILEGYHIISNTKYTPDTCPVYVDLIVLTNDIVKKLEKILNTCKICKRTLEIVYNWYPQITKTIQLPLADKFNTTLFPF